MTPSALVWSRRLAPWALALSLIAPAGPAPAADAGPRHPPTDSELARFLALKQAGAEIPPALAKAVEEEGGQPGPERESGGPDAFGYVWLDDNEAAGPVFEWVDISVDPNAVALTPLSDDGYIANIAMGIDFPFYGIVQTTVNVAMNGFINFGTGSGSLSNTALPTAAAPNNLIAVFWDDLDPGDGVGAIHTLSNPAAGTFTVQWTGVPDFPGPNSPPNTFQVILHESGSITVQYLDMQGDHLGCTVGIENATGTIGLQATFNGTGMAIENDKAVRFALSEVDIIGPTISHAPLGNTDASGGAASYPVAASIVDSQSGVAGAVLHYQVDGGAFETVEMAAGAPPLWEGAIPGQAVGATIAYFITATDDFEPPNTSTSPTWSFRIIDYTLPPAGLTASEGLLDIVNVAWTAPVWLAARGGQAGPRPLFEDFLARHASKEQAWQAFQRELADWVAAGHVAERTFLNYNIYRDGELVGTSATLAFTDYPPEQNTDYSYHVTALFSSGESDPSNSDTGNMVGRPTQGGPDAMGYVWFNSRDDAGPGFDWVDISGTGTPITPLTDDGFTGPYDLGFNFPLYDAAFTQVFVASNGFLTFGSGNGTLTNSALPSTSIPNNLVAAFWDDMAPHYAGGTIHYLADAPNSRFIVQWHVPAYGSVAPYVFFDFQVILNSGGLIQVQFLDVNEADVAQATIGIENSTGTIGLQVNFNDAGGLIADELAISIIPQEGDFVPPFIVHTPLLSVETELQGGYDVTADITDDSGVESARIVYAFFCDAPATTEIYTVTGDEWAGQIPHLDEGSSVAYHLEANDAGPNHALAVSPTWTFQVVSYLWPPVNLAATDGSLLQTIVTWLAPVDPGLLAARFGDQLPRDRDEGVERLMAQGLGKEQALSEWEGLFSESERAFIQYQVYRDGELAGTTTGLSFTDNLGHGAQNEVVYSYTVRALFSAGESDPSNADTGFWSLGQTSGGPDNYGYVWRNSSDPSGPEYQWEDIVASGTALTLTDDSFQGPIALGFPFPYYENSYTECYVSSNGHISFGAGSSSLSNSTLPSTSTPNNLIAPFWDDLYPVAAVPGGSVKYLSDAANGRFILQYTHIPHCCNANGPAETFQAILYNDGRILFQYSELLGSIISCTVGIENSTGTDGLQYIYNGTGAPLANSLAIAFVPPVGPVIAHTPLVDIETELPGAHVVTAQISSELGVASAAVVYSINGGAAQTVAMTHGAGDSWSGDIPHQGAGTLVAYHIEATDAQQNTRLSMTWNFDVVSYHWPPVNLIASDGLLSQTNISWLPPVDPGLLAHWFGESTPRSEVEAEARLMAEQGLDKQEALDTWRGFFARDERVFVQYKLYRDGLLLGQTTTTTFIDDASQGSESDVTYSYTVTAEFTAGESNPSIGDDGYWGSPPNSGGPDGFGYTWRNSLNAGGPAYQWTDISAQGTVVTLTDDSFAGPFELGFTFPFYTEMETQVFIGSNGFLSFGAGNNALTNQNLPNPTTPNNVIAAFWDDLNPGNAASGDVYYWSDAESGRFIVQYQEIVAFGGSVPFTFEVILESSGAITMQYQDLNEADLVQSTIGIEDAAGGTGLTALFDGTGGAIGDAMAYGFLPPSNCEPVDCAGLPETEPNEGWGDDNQSWNVIRCGDTRCGTVLADGTTTDTDWYLYTHFGGNITVSLDVSDFNGRISLRQQAVDGQTIASANGMPRCFDEAFTVGDLASGAYYVVVEHAGAPDVTEPQSYNVSLTCSGDPCSGHLPIECTGSPEAEPNEGWNAVPPNDNYGEIVENETICGVVTASGGARDMDWFHFHVDAPDTVSFSAAIDAFDAALFLTQFDPAGSVLAEVDDAPACAPEVLSLAALPAGDYFIVIGHNSFDGVPAPQAYSLTFGQAGQPEDPCVNYVDVGNFHDIWTAARPAPINTHHDGTGCPGGISSPGRDEVTRLNLTQTTDLQITLHGEGLADEVILLLGNCAQPQSSCGAAVDAQGADMGSEVLTLQNVPAGDYFIVADFAGMGETHPYFLSIVDMESGLAEGRPLAFELEPCHPNPFNPSTTIEWAQPGLAHAGLTIHDLRGAVVEEIDLGVRGAGRHAFVWDASRHGSGVYFYTLRSGAESRTRKAVLVK